jgi:SAM-dependent methyltransferase
MDNTNRDILSEKKFIGENYICDKFSITKKDFDEIFVDGLNILEYEVLVGHERDSIIQSIINKINSSDLRISGENNNEVWEKGWGEILASIKNDFSPEKIMPQYFDHHNIMRLDGQYIKGITDNFVYKYDQIIRKIILKRYAETSSSLIELGCGTGSGTFLAASTIDKNIKITASDWASASLPIVNEISKFTKRDIKAVQFNMLDMNGYEELSIKNDSTVLSFHALEQLGGNYKNLLHKLQSEKVLCVHLEPIYEYYNKDNLFDTLAKNYHKKRNYLGNFLTDIKQLELEGKAEILEELRIGFGDRYHEAYGLLVWRGK